MNKRFVLVLLSILLFAGLVFAATQEFKHASSRSRTARIQELYPLTDTTDKIPIAQEEEIIKALLTEEQRAALDKQPKDIGAAFSRVAVQFQRASGDSDA